MKNDCVCVCLASCVGPPVALRGLAVFIARPANARAATCVFLFAVGAIGRSRALAAGATWTSRTTSAPWAVRAEHTTVIDAAGAIYVIGGQASGTFYQDVWASTDGGA